MRETSELNAAKAASLFHRPSTRRHSLPCSPTAGYRTLGRSCNPEARVFRADPGSCGVAVGGAQKARVVVPGTAAKNSEAAIWGCNGRAVRRRAGIAVLVAVLDPLPDVAVHVVQA